MRSFNRQHRSELAARSIDQWLVQYHGQVHDAWMVCGVYLVLSINKSLLCINTISGPYIKQANVTRRTNTSYTVLMSINV